MAQVRQRLNVSRRTLRRLQQISDYKGDPVFQTSSQRYRFQNKFDSLAGIRSFIYESSVFIGDVGGVFANTKPFRRARGNMLKFGKVLGDVNAGLGTVKRAMDMEATNTIGERFVRRVGGRAIGKILQAMPKSNVGSAVATRAARSVVGANLQREFDRLVRTQVRGQTFESQLVMNLQKAAKGLPIENALDTIVMLSIVSVKKFTPVWTGALKSTLKGSVTGKGADGLPQAVIEIGDGLEKNYAPYIEYGLGSGFNVGAQYLEKYFPTPEVFQALRSSSRDRRAVKSSRNGAMMRRGMLDMVKKSGFDKKDVMFGNKSWERILSENARKMKGMD